MTHVGNNYYVIFQTSWGPFGLLANGQGLLRTSLPGPDTAARLLAGIERARQDRALFADLQCLIRCYFDGAVVDLSDQVPLVLEANPPYTRAVLEACAKVRFGQVLTYMELAARAGRPRAVRPTANALARNPLPLIIPCHRIVRSNGQIGGFSGPGGIATKRRLLEHESVSIGSKPTVGFEPTTAGLQNQSSTIELRWQHI